MGKDRSPLTAGSVAQLPRIPRIFGVIGIIGLLILACVAAMWVRNGVLDCSVLDRWLKLTPCRAVLVSGIAYRNDVAFSPDSRFVAIAAETVTLWDVATGAYIQTFPLPGDGQPTQVRFSPDGASIAVVGPWGTQVLDVTTMRVRYTLPTRDATGIAFSADGRWLAQSEEVRSAHDSFGQVRIFDAADGHVVRTMPGRYQLGYADDLYFTPDSHHLLVWIEPPSPSTTRIAGWIWNITNDQITEGIGYGDVSADARWLRPYDGTGSVMALNDTNDQYVVHHTPAHGCPGGWATAFLSDPDRVISVSNDYDKISFAFWSSEPYTRVCRLADGAILWQSKAQGFCVKVAPNNRVVAVCEFSRVQLWDVPPEWNP